MIIITGASSFVGRNLLRNIPDDSKVLCLVRRKIDELKVRQEIVDFYDDNDLDKYINKGDVVVHILGITEGSRKKLNDINFKITKNIIDSSVRKKASRIIFLSTAIVEMKNKGDYGGSKLNSENYLKNSGVPYVILRPTIIYGKGEKKFIGKIINSIKNNLIVPIIGDGKYYLSPIYIEDVVKIIEKSIYSDFVNETFYLAGSERISMNEICKNISEALGKNTMFFNLPLPLLTFASPFARIISKRFPSVEQLKRITDLPEYDTKKAQNLFKVQFRGFHEGINEVLG